MGLKNVAVASFFTVLVLAGCAGSVNTVPIAKPTPSPTPTPTPTPVPTPSPGPIVLSSISLAFTAAGVANAQTVTAGQSGFSGTFSTSTAPAGQQNSCSGIATIAAATRTSFTVTPAAAGACTFAIAGGAGQSATLAVTVTITNVGGS